MTTQQHSAEPWACEPDMGAIYREVDAENSNVIARIQKHGVERPADKRRIETHFYTPEDLANAARIVACVNACAGLSQAHLEEVAPQDEMARLSSMINILEARISQLLHPKAPEWSGSPDPEDPDNFWIDDETGERVNAHTGERTKPA